MLAAVELRENITALREKRGWNRNRLAEKSGLTASQIKEIEDGKNLNPGLQTLEKIRVALGATPNELFLGGEGSGQYEQDSEVLRVVEERVRKAEQAIQSVREAVAPLYGSQRKKPKVSHPIKKSAVPR